MLSLVIHSQQVIKQNVTGIQWMTSNAVTTATIFQNPHFLPYMRGTLGLSIRRGEIPGLKDFLLKIHPDNDPDNSHENAIVSLLFGFSSSTFKLASVIIWSQSRVA